MRQGRFAKRLLENMRTLNASVGYDRRLFREDIAGSVAWAGALERAGLLSAAESAEIRRGLRDIEEEIAAGSFAFSEELEDIHMNVEARLIERIGDPGAKLHTGRSRNDQVATDLRLYLKRAASAVLDDLAAIQRALVRIAERELDVLIPAYTHLQRAQPVLFAHHILAYAEMLERDRQRFRFAREAADVLVLGSGACVGNGFGIDRDALAAALEFAATSRNSMDAVSDRDFVADFLYAASLLGVHLSRLSEDLILWSASEFALVRLDESLSTGSSMLPQKRNPDAAELARSKCGRFLGNLVRLVTTLKGLPLTYNKDLQEDKEAVFDAVDTLALLLPVVEAMVDTLYVDRERAARLLEGGFLEATSVADYLTRKGMPFRRAHDVVGRLVRRCEELGQGLGALPLEEYRRFSELFADDLFAAISTSASVADKDVIGGTSPRRVQAEIERWKQALAPPRHAADSK